jgi:hypothetical protein
VRDKMGETGSMGMGGGWVGIIDQVLGGSSGGSQAGDPYGSDVVSNVLGPLTPQYWVRANYAKKAQTIEQDKTRATTKLLKLQGKKLEGEMDRQRKIRNLIMGYK